MSEAECLRLGARATSAASVAEVAAVRFVDVNMALLAATLVFPTQRAAQWLHLVREATNPAFFAILLVQGL